MKLVPFLLRYFTFLFFLIFINELSAQQDIRKWSDGKLTWADFQEKPNYITSKAKIETGISHYVEKKKFNDTVVVGPIFFIYMDTMRSWINPIFKSDTMLRFFQVGFDLSEIHIRGYQRMFDIGKYDTTFWNNADLEMERFEREVKNGKSMDVIETWEKYVSETLKKLDTGRVVNYRLGNFGYGIHIGFATGLFPGSLGNTFNPAYGATFGFDFSYKNLVLFINGSFYGTSVKPNYNEGLSWYDGKSAAYTTGDLSLGYTVYDGAKFKLRPYLGYNFTEFSSKNELDKDNPLMFTNNNVVLGLSADYKLKKKYHINANGYINIPYSTGYFFNYSEYVETSLKAKLSLTHVEFSSDLKGYIINLSVSISGFGRFIKFGY